MVRVHNLEVAGAHTYLIGPGVVVHNCQNLKKGHTLRGMLAKPLIGRSNVCILATGTAIDNRPTDLHNLLQLARPNKQPGLYAWAERYFAVRNTENGFGRTIDELVHKEKLRADVADVMVTVSMQEAFGELPAVTRTIRQVQVDGSFRISPEKCRMAKSEDKLQQMLHDCVASKIAAAVEWVTDEVAGDPVVLYVYRPSDAVLLGKALTKSKITNILATGATTATKRAKDIDIWKAGGAQALVCTMDAVQTSATLTRADTMAFLDVDRRGGKHLQCEGRIHPSRQDENNRRPVTIHYFVTENGPDEVVMEAVLAKLREAEGIGGDDRDAAGLKDMLGGVVQNSMDTNITPVQLSDVVTLMEARAARLADLGML